MSLKSAPTAFRHTMTLMAGGNTLPTVLEAIVLSVEAEAPGILCSILLLDKTGEQLTLGAGPSLPSHYNAAIEGVRVGPNVGSCGTAIHTGRRVIVADIQTDPLWTNFKDLAASAGLRACWSQPIFAADGQAVGSFAIYLPNIGVPSDDDITFIETAAELASIAIERQRAREALALSLERASEAVRIETETARDLTTFFEVSLDMLCIRDMDRRFVKVNKAWETTLGYTVAELEGSPMLSLVHPEDAGDTQGHMDRMLTADEVTGFVNRYRHRDGSYRHLEWRARRVGEHVYGVARDVTERLAFEAEIRAAKQAAEAANQAKSDFLANMSHEIRTPLNGVIGVVDALSRTELSTSQREMIGLIESSGVTLERLVSDILDVSKIEAGRLEIERRALDLGDEFASLIEVHQAQAQEKGLTFRTVFGPRARGEFHGDATRIKQVLGNLLANAVKFTPAGEVRLVVEVDEATGVDLPTMVRFEVHDTGMGFDAEAGAALFQRFSQADTTITRRFGGTGLGLSICKALAELMDGAISARSEVGVGSVFSVTLPLPRRMSLDAYDAARRQARPEPGPPPPANPTGSLKILLAEDHPTNQKVVQMILAPYGIDVTIVENGADALEAMRTAEFSLVLMDMQMPVMDGLAATRLIRAEERNAPGRPRTPIIMLSANAMNQHRLDALDAGADLHVAKPVTAASLIAGITQAIEAVDQEPTPDRVPAA